MKLTKEQAIEAIKNGKSLKDFSEWKDNKEVVLKALKREGWDLEYASERLKDDKEVVMAAFKIDGWALQYVSESLRDDKEVVLEAIKKTGWVLDYASDRLKGDKEVVLVAIKKNGWNLRYASPEIRDKMGNNNSVEFLEQWIKSEKQQEFLEQQLDKKENIGKIKL